jgi:GTP-binding protein HflX
MEKEPFTAHICQAPKTVLVALDTGQWDSELSLDELSELARTAGAEVAAVMTQKRPAPDPASCIGSGRLEELADFVRSQDVQLVIFDLELSPVQLRNIEKACECRIIDRTMLILDIFAQRANTAEGKLQVELAQQRYLLPRLVGLGQQLSRLGGGIGTRGPGETKLETDRRHIRRRIAALEEQLRGLERHRSLLRERRKKDGVTVVAIMGYTNVGKSTLLNRLTDAGVLSQDMLFATLDPTARALTLPDGRQVMLVDTVGLIRRLPHHLVNAFHSTLEEAAQADLILNLCDGAALDWQAQLEVTRGLLAELGASQIPVLTVFNKCDLTPAHTGPAPREAVRISALTGEGIDRLLEAVAAALVPSHRRLTLCIPFDRGGLLSKIRAQGRVLSQRHTENGTLIDAMVDIRMADSVKEFSVENDI